MNKSGYVFKNYNNFPEKLLQLWAFRDCQMIFDSHVKHDTLNNHRENIHVEVELGQDEDKYLEESKRFQSGDDWILSPGENLAQLQAHV